MKNPNNRYHFYKTLLAAFEAADFSTFEAKKFLSDQRLTQKEKKILECYIQMRLNDFSLVDGLKNDTSFKSDQFLNALRCLMIGAVQVYRAIFDEGESYLSQAKELMLGLEKSAFVSRMTFKVESNLFYHYMNLKHLSSAEKVFQRIEKLEIDNKDQNSLKLISFCFYSMMGNLARAEELLIQLEREKDSFDDMQLISFKIEQFDFCIKLGLLEKAQFVLNEMKKIRTFRLSQNYNFCLKMLNFLLKNEPIYVYERDFTEGKNLFAMLKVISCLDTGDHVQAAHYWNVLSVLSPSTYKKDFSYHGDTCLFSLALSKVQNLGSTQIFELKGNYAPLELSLISAFKNQNTTILLKEELFESVYKKKVESKDDLKPLALLVWRINKKEEFSIKSKKDSYVIELLKKKAS